MADPGEGLRGLAPPLLGSFQTFLATHVYPFFIPKIIVWVIIWVSVQEDCSCSSSWLLNHPNARSIFDEDLHARNLLGLLQSIIVYQALQLDDEVEGMLFCEKDIPFPKSLGNEVLGWKTLWQSTDRWLAMKMLSQTSMVFWSLPTPYRSQALKLSNHFHWWNKSRSALGQQCLKSDSLTSHWSPDALFREIRGRGRRDMPLSLCKGSSKKALSS